MSKSSERIYAIAAFAAAAVFAAIRIIVTFLFTEKYTGVYLRGSIFPQIFQCLLAVAVIFFIVFPCVKKMKKCFESRTLPANSKVTVFTSAVLGFMFLASSLLLLFTMVSQMRFGIADTILAITGIFSSAYYLSRIFSRGCRAEGTALLSMVPIVWALTVLIDVYFDMSILITSPNRIFSQLALLAFSVFLLAETRMALHFDNTLLYAPASAVSTILLAVSAIPNLLCPHILSVGDSDRPIIYAVELAACIYSASKLYAYCAHGEQKESKPEEQTSLNEE